jgi:hypothetical protein
MPNGRPLVVVKRFDTGSLGAPILRLMIADIGTYDRIALRGA